MDVFKYFVFEITKDGTDKLVGIFNNKELANDFAEYEETFLKAHYVVREGVKTFRKGNIMDRGNDTVQFESRREVENIMIALGEYIKRHKKDDDTTLRDVQTLFDNLDAIHMNW